MPEQPSRHHTSVSLVGCLRDRSQSSHLSEAATDLVLLSWRQKSLSHTIPSLINVTESEKTGLIHTSTEIQFLFISERYTHALPRNTKYLAIDGQVCFYRRLFSDAVKPRRCMSWSWGASIGLHGVPNCSSRQSGPPLWIVPVHVTY